MFSKPKKKNSFVDFIKKNKVKVSILSVLVILIIIAIFAFGISNKSKRREIAKLGNKKQEAEYSYNVPYIPEGFSHKEGTWDTGYVIEEDTTGNQFVWVPVDNEDVKLERKSFGSTMGSETLDKGFKNSVEKYGGFYVARYEAGVPEISGFTNDTENKDISGKPVSKKGVYVWNNISNSKAKMNAIQMYVSKPEITSTIMNSYAYDTMLTWIEQTSGYNVDTDSKDWGNYSNSNLGTRKLELTGNRENWKVNNIYDLAGNAAEWTSEKSSSKYIYRGGSYTDQGNTHPAGSRNSYEETRIENNIGFRVIIYKNENTASAEFANPTPPRGFTYVEGEWDTGYVIRDNSGNEFVWVPINWTNLGLERSDFENSLTKMDRCVDSLNEDFMRSIYKYGGFYVARYESGVGTTSGNNVGVPVSKPNVDVWTNISRENAKLSAEKMYEGNTYIKSDLMSSFAYDTIMNWLKAEGYTQTQYNVDTDSSTWGNYNGTKQKTGVGNHKANNIYDLAGNVWELTTESYGEDAVARGGDYLSSGSVVPAGARDHAKSTDTFDYTGFRVVMYYDVENTENGDNEIQIATGDSCSIYKNSEGILYFTGRNSNGLAGNGTKDSTQGAITKFTKISDMQFSKIPANITEHALAIDKDGYLWAWGYNNNGELGIGNSTSQYSPVKVTEDILFKEIAVGSNSSFAIDMNGDLYSCGRNDDYKIDQPYKVYSGQNGSGIYKTLRKVEEDYKFKKVAAGKDHALALTTDGKVLLFGNNSKNQLGVASTSVNRTIKAFPNKEVKEIAAGEKCSFILFEDGSIEAYGDDTYGSLGNGTSNNSSMVSGNITFSKVKAYGHYVTALDENGYIYIWGSNIFEPQQVIINSEPNKKFKEIAQGFNGARFALDENNNLWAWGYNYWGELGLNRINGANDRVDPAELVIIQDESE